MIAAGVYQENVVIEDDDAVTLKGQGDVTIKHPEIDIAAGEEPEDVIEAEGDVRFQNLRVEGLFIGDDVGGRGIDAQDGAFTLINVQIVGTDGDALRVRDFTTLHVFNGRFSSLDADGMDIEDGGSVWISHTSSFNNEDEGLEVDGADSVVVIGGEYLNNGDDGIDVDDSTNIRIVNVLAAGNDGNGFQVEAENVPIERVEVVGSRFYGNNESGVEIVARDAGSIALLQLFGNDSRDNVEFGYEIDIAGAIQAEGNKASGNGDDTLP
jgi:hypothetical protein